MNPLHLVRVVLVATSHAGNIGAVARAIKNMGLSQLVLVTPKNFPNIEATARASGADDILQTAKVVNSLDEALTGCHLVLGASARERQIPWPIVNPKEAAMLSIESLEKQLNIALVFGREHAGLTNDELARCHYHVYIPAHKDFSSLNLAAAVQILTYEIRMAFLEWQHLPTKIPKLKSTLRKNSILCTYDDVEQFYQQLEETLINIHFLDPKRPKHLMTRLRRLYSKAQITKIEMNILRGILTETNKSIESKTKLK